jgi:hypothetical protein
MAYILIQIIVSELTLFSQRDDARLNVEIPNNLGNTDGTNKISAGSPPGVPLRRSSAGSDSWRLTHRADRPTLKLPAMTELRLFAPGGVPHEELFI